MRLAVPFSKPMQYTWLGLLLLSVLSFGYTENPMTLIPPALILFAFFFINNWQSAYWLLLFLIPISIQVWFLNDRLSTSIPDEPITWAFLLLGLIMFAWKPNIISEKWWRQPLVLLVGLQYIWTFITVFYSQELFYSIKFFLAKSWMIMAYFIFPVLMFKTKNDYKKANKLILIATLLTVVIIFSRHVFQYQLKFWKVEHAIDPLYFNHVDYSTFISMVFPLLFSTWLLTPKKYLALRGFLLGLMLYYLAAIYFSYARAAVLAVVFSFTMMMAIKWRLSKLVILSFYAIVILLLSYFATGDNYMSLRPNFEKTYMRENFIDHIKATFKGKDMSSMERLYRWIAGTRMSKDHPLVGYGPNSFYYNYKPYAVTTFQTYVSRNPEGSTSHNYFLYMLTEQGWPAMLLYALLVYVFFAQAQATYHRFKDVFYKTTTLTLAMVFAACFINNFFSELIETNKIGALYYMSISLMALLTIKSHAEARGEAVH